MTNNNLTEYLVATLRKYKNPAYVTTSRTEISVRCCYCGDSVKSSKSAHLYIELQSPYRFYCQRCSTSGLVTPDFLKDLQVHDSKLSLEFYKLNKDIRYSGPRVANQVSHIIKKDVSIPIPKGNENELEKLNYLNGRLGLNLELNDVLEYRIVLNFSDFFVENEISSYVISDDMMRNLNQYGLGFLSYDRSHIIFRSIVDKEISGFRYYNYNIFNDYNNTRKFYSIQTNINYTDLRVKVVLAEGIFDIISIRENLFKTNKNIDNILFFAINGKGYNLVINTLNRLGFLDLDIEIFSDKDVGISFYRYMKRNNYFLRYSRIKVNYNRLDKDFGVPKDRIKLKHSFV